MFFKPASRSTAESVRTDQMIRNRGGCKGDRILAQGWQQVSASIGQQQDCGKTSTCFAHMQKWICHNDASGAHLMAQLVNQVLVCMLHGNRSPTQPQSQPKPYAAPQSSSSRPQCMSHQLKHGALRKYTPADTVASYHQTTHVLQLPYIITHAA
jgi:hypothetical protein